MEKLEFSLEGLKKFVSNVEKYLGIGTALYLEVNVGMVDLTKPKSGIGSGYEAIRRRDGRRLQMNFGSWDNEVRYYILPSSYVLVAFAAICEHKDRLWEFDFDSEWAKAHDYCLEGLDVPRNDFRKKELEVLKKNYDDIDGVNMAECVLFNGVERREIYSMFPELIDNGSVYPFVYKPSRNVYVTETIQLNTPTTLTGEFPERALEGTDLFYHCWKAAQKIRAAKAGFKI